jgi:serine/threonine protein phosphatase PrpC
LIKRQPAWHDYILRLASKKFAADTHSGLRRRHNEDCYEADQELGLWLVADGVGGHASGEVASDIVRATVKQGISRGKTLHDAIVASHEAVLEATREHKSTQGMGSTVIALLLDGDNYELAWVGDSRAYLWSAGLQQLSEDHNRVSELLASKVITPEQAVKHPERHVLTQSLGVSEKNIVTPGQLQGTLRKGEQILLCSDGLSDELSDKVIASIMDDQQTPRAQVDTLIKAALDAGGNDNITAVVIGDCAAPTAGNISHNLEITRNTRSEINSRVTHRAGFPLKALIFISVLALLVLWILL